jgi:hypothetical protein
VPYKTLIQVEKCPLEKQFERNFSSLSNKQNTLQKNVSILKVHLFEIERRKKILFVDLVSSIPQTNLNLFA